MNKKQMLVLWVGIILVVIMGLFPPYFGLTIFGISGDPGYYPIFAPPSRGRLDISRLVVQWLIICFVTGGLIASLRGSANPMNPKTEVDRNEATTEPASEEPVPYKPMRDRPDYVAALKAVPPETWKKRLPMISTPSIDRKDHQQPSTEHEQQKP